MNIKTKILFLALGITALCAISFMVAANIAIEKGGKFILAQSINLGKDSAQKSRATLEEQARANLTRLVSIQTQSSNEFFSTTRMEVETMTKFCSLLWSTRETVKTKAADNNNFLYRRAPGVDEQKVKNEFSKLRVMGTIFQSYLANNENLESLFLGTQTGINILWPDTKASANKAYDPRTRPWYKDAVKRNHIGWTDIFKGASTSKLMIACSNPVYDDRGVPRGVVGATVTLDKMLKVISSQVRDMGYAFLLDKNGKVIAFPALDKAEQSQDYGSVNLRKSDNLEFRAIVEKMVAGEKGFSKIRLNTGEKFIGFAPVKETGWSMAVVIATEHALALADQTEKNIMAYTLEKREEMVKKIQAFQKYAILFFGLMLALAVFISVKVSNRISRPILDLTKGVEDVGKGNLDRKLSIRTGDEIETLAQAFNNMTQDLTRYIKNLQETTAAKEKIESELQVATRIQNSMLPRVFPAFPKRKEFSVFASMEPAREVGGDLYDFFFISETKFCFLVGDVAGKGVPASLFMVVAKTLIKNEALRGIPPKDIFFNVNNALCEDNDEGMFVTGFVCIIDLETGQVDFANAGHNPPLVLESQNKAYDFMEIIPGFVLGGMPDFEYETQSICMAPEDVLFLYTDGVNEAMDPENNEYTDARLKETLSMDSSRDVTQIVKSVAMDVKEFTKGAEQSDDITILAFKYKGPAV